MERTKKGNPVIVTAEVMEGLEAVRLSGKTNMFDVNRVIELALQMGHVEAAMWVYDNRRLYSRAILVGFAVEEVPAPCDSSHRVAEPAACGHEVEQSVDADEPGDTSQGGDS